MFIKFNAKNHTVWCYFMTTEKNGNQHNEKVHEHKWKYIVIAAVPEYFRRKDEKEDEEKAEAVRKRYTSNFTMCDF